jgi:TRAP-type C4-dicarboxylate transport system permease small subunit
MKTFTSFLAVFDRRLVQLMRVICLCCFTLLLLLLAGNVFVRIYAGFYDRVPSFIRIPIMGFYWFDEVVEWTFAWMVFFGAAALWARGEHFKLEWIAAKMQGTRIGHLIVGGLELISLFFLLIFAYYSLQLTILAKDWTPYFNVSRRFLYVCMPVAGFIMVGYSIRNVVREALAFLKFPVQSSITEPRNHEKDIELK